MDPSTLALAMYSQFLSNSYKAPGTVKNHLSGVRAWLSLHGGSTTKFFSPEVGLMTKSIIEKSDYIPSPAPAITREDVRTICLYLNRNPSPPAVKAAVLLAFTTFMRVSNILSPNIHSWGGRHTLKAQDIHSTTSGLKVVIRSTKTRRGRKPHILDVYPADDQLVCPVLAWHAYKRIIQPCPLGPAFMINDHTPLTTGPVVSAMRSALSQAGKIFPTEVSFHSLRRGGAQAAAKLGATQEEIMSHGTWASKNGVKTYLQPNPRIVPTILARTLAKEN